MRKVERRHKQMLVFAFLSFLEHGVSDHFADIIFAEARPAMKAENERFFRLAINSTGRPEL